MPSASASPATASTVGEAVALLLGLARRRGPRAGATTVIGVDGPSGSGKTTLVRSLVAAAEEGGDHVAVIRMDDLCPGWDGLAQATDLLVDRVLAPLARGERAWAPVWDWHADRWGDPREIPTTTRLLVLDGVGCGSRRARPCLSALAWLDADPDERRRRALARDGDTFAPWWDRWAAQEADLWRREGTAGHADVRLGT